MASWPCSRSTVCRIRGSFFFHSVKCVSSTVAPDIITTRLCQQVSPPTTLTYLSSQVFYLGSHFGDSQLLRVHSSPFSALKLPTLLIAPSVVTVSPDFLISNDKGKGKAGVDSRKDIGRVVRSQGNFLEVMDTWKNIAPIMDAVLADTDGSGHVSLVC